MKILLLILSHLGMLRIGFLIYKWKVLNEYEKKYNKDIEMTGKPFFYL